MIKIEINCEPDFLDAHIRALGFIRTPSVTLGEQRHEPTREEQTDAIMRGDPLLASPIQSEMTDAQAEAYTKTEEQFRADAPKVDKANPDRPWGQSSPGKKRRSGAEVAEDEAYYAAHANDPPTVTNTPRAAEATISAGEERVSTEEDIRNDVALRANAQDAADEAAETAARKSDKLTLEDVRRAVAKWSEIVGPANVIAKLRDILGGYALIDLPEAEWPKAIENLEWAAANPASTVVGVANGAAPELKVKEPKIATKEEVIAAIVDYGKKYDGSAEPDKMLLTKEDLPKVFGKMFGAGVTGLGSMPKTPEAFGQITAAIVAATRDNPFKREIRA